MRKWVLGIGLILLAYSCRTPDTTLKIAATTIPHAELLRFIQEDLIHQGVNLKIIEVDDYTLPNRMVQEGDVDANFFQHQSFLDEEIRMHGYDLMPLTAVHIEPLGIYSLVYRSIDAIKNGSKVAIPQDPTNEARALLLLQDIGLIKIRKSIANLNCITPLDIIENPQHLKFEELDASYLVRGLSDVDLSIIPSNFALQGKLNPLRDPIAVECIDHRYANIVVIKPKDLNKENFQKLKQALNTDKLRLFIEEKYRGSILPSF
ncbi:MAG: MetQ/NlpA family ABC transporter substrate-binding protein [Chlamydiales bacterium]